MESESQRRGAAIRPPDPGEQIKATASALFTSIEIQCIFLEALKADQKNALQLICDESGYIWWEINDLLRHDPSRLLRVWNQIEEYREVLLDIHIAVDRDPSLPGRDIDDFCNILRNILDNIRNASGGAGNHTLQHRSGSNSIVQGARNVNMTGGRYAIYNYNTGPELVHLVTLNFESPPSSMLPCNRHVAIHSTAVCGVNSDVTIAGEHVTPKR